MSSHLRQTEPPSFSLKAGIKSELSTTIWCREVYLNRANKEDTVKNTDFLKYAFNNFIISSGYRTLIGSNVLFYDEHVLEMFWAGFFSPMAWFTHL